MVEVFEDFDDLTVLPVDQFSDRAQPLSEAVDIRDRVIAAPVVAPIGIQAIEIFDAITPAERYKLKVGLVSRHANHIGNLADELLHTIPSAGPI